MASAMQQVLTVRVTYGQQFATAAASDKERIAEEGNKAMEKAITDQGLSVEEYTAILNAAQNDPDVGDKLVQRLQAK